MEAHKIGIDKKSPLITINNGLLQLDNTLTFNNLTTIINKGDFIVVIGDNGSGKSALLKAISGKIPFSKGDITYHFNRSHVESNEKSLSIFKNIAFMDVRHSFKDRQNMQTLFYQQRYNSSFSDDSITVMEYLIEAVNKSQSSGYWNQSSIIEKLELKSLLQKNLIKLSNGESRRVRIAEVALSNPTLMLLDQPFSGIDIKNREILLSFFKEIKSSGTTLIMVCSETEIPEYADTIISLKLGSQPTITSYDDYTPSGSKPSIELDADDLSFLKMLPQFSEYNSIVKMENINISYGKTQILNNLSWHIKQGEHWSLSGANGSGKSTLLSLITGDNPQAYSNRITLFDRLRGSGESIWDIKSKIGFVSPEMFQFFPTRLTCREAVSTGFTDFMIKPKNITPQQDATIDKWLKLLKINEYRDVAILKLPVTVQRLTLLARAMVKHPPLLILDEPCQGFDDYQQQYFRGIIDILSLHTNLTWIYVTHKQEQLPESVTHKIRIDVNN